MVKHDQAGLLVKHRLFLLEYIPLYSMLREHMSFSQTPPPSRLGCLSINETLNGGINMQSNNKRTIYLATPKELNTESYYWRLWITVKNLPIPRRNWLDEIADTLRDFEGVVIERTGEPFPLPLVDDIFGHDPDMRWLGYFLKSDHSGVFPHSKSRKLKRLQLLDVYFRIKHPDIARHFG
jgi:hypothetical protein